MKYNYFQAWQSRGSMKRMLNDTSYYKRGLATGYFNDGVWCEIFKKYGKNYKCTLCYTEVVAVPCKDKDYLLFCNLEDNGLHRVKRYRQHGRIKEWVCSVPPTKKKYRKKKHIGHFKPKESDDGVFVVNE